MPRANNNVAIRERAKANLAEQSTKRAQRPKHTQRKPGAQKIPPGTFLETQRAFDSDTPTQFGAYVRKFVMNPITDRFGNEQRPQLKFAPLLFLFQLLYFRLILDAKTTARIDDFKKKEGKISNDDYKRIFFQSPTIQSLLSGLFGMITFSQEDGKTDQQIVYELMSNSDESSILGTFKRKYTNLLKKFDESESGVKPNVVDYSLYHNIFPSIDTSKERDQIALREQLEFEKHGVSVDRKRLFIPPAITLIRVLEKKLDYLGSNMNILDESYEIIQDYTPTWGSTRPISTPFTFIVGELIHSSITLFDKSISDADINEFLSGQRKARDEAQKRQDEYRSKQTQKARKEFQALSTKST